MRLCLLISTIVAAGLSVSAAAQVSVDLIRGDLSRLPIRLMEITGDSIVWEEPTGDIATLPLSDALGLAARGDSRNDARPDGALRLLSFEPSMLRLIDGRRLTGSLSAQAALPDVLRWQHPVLGAVDVPLEQIDRLLLQRATVGAGAVDLLPAADRQDVVLLRNGDRLEGFVVDLGRDAVIEVDGRDIVVPMETVHQVAFANPRELWDGPMVWLRDGSVLGASMIRFDGGAFSVVQEPDATTEAKGIDGAAPETGSGQSVLVRPEHVEAVSFDTRSLVSVSRLIEATAGEQVSGAFGAAPIELMGETSIMVELPSRARRVVLKAELPLRARAWGRCELVLATDGVVRARLPLSAATPAIDYELDLDGAHMLELILKPGEFGRVQSMVEVRDALIAVD